MGSTRPEVPTRVEVYQTRCKRGLGSRGANEGWGLLDKVLTRVEVYQT